LFYLLLPLVVLRLIWRGLKAPGYLEHWPERFGFGPRKSGAEDVIWVHAVSAGESIAAVPLIRRLQVRFPDKQFVVSNMTPTGAERIRTLLGESVVQCYAPYDLPGMVKRFLNRLQPSLFLIIDTELWPNMIHYSKTMGIKSMLVNGRLSAKSAAGYARIGLLVKPMLNEISLISTQTQQHGDRFIELGLSKHKLSVTGSIKFDLVTPEDLVARRKFLRQKLGQDRLVIVAASTHPGEDEVILEVFKLLKEKLGNALLVTIPRHPERFNSVASQYSASGLCTIRHSDEVSCDATTDVLIVDSMGELIYFYAVADVAFVGGSLVPVGGHNMMEAAAFAVPIIMGPHLQNIDDIARLFVEAGAMEVVQDSNGLLLALQSICTDEIRRSSMADSAIEVMQQNKGALDKVMALIDELGKANSTL
jgi:3-deoxy-D-manno-octulosonic-acid transferase